MVLFFIGSFFFACTWLFSSEWSFLLDFSIFFFFLYKAEKISFLVCVRDCVCVSCGAVDFFARLCYSWSNVARRMLLFAPQTQAETRHKRRKKKKILEWFHKFLLFTLFCFWFLFCVSWHNQWSSSTRFHRSCFKSSNFFARSFSPGVEGVGTDCR